MRFGTHVFADEREAAEALLAAGFIPVGRDGTRHYRHPDRDTDRWVQRAAWCTDQGCGRTAPEPRRGQTRRT